MEELRNLNFNGSAFLAVDGEATENDSLDLLISEDGEDILINEATIAHQDDGSVEVSLGLYVNGLINDLDTENSEQFSIDEYFTIDLPKLEELEQEEIKPTKPEMFEAEVYVGGSFYIGLSPDDDGMYHDIYFELGGQSGLVASGVYEGLYWDVPEEFNTYIPFKNEGTMTVIVDSYTADGSLVGQEKGYINIIKSYFIESFPATNIDDKIIIYDKDDIHFQSPLVILDSVNEVSIKETLNAEFELNLNVAYNDKSRHVKVDNYVQIMGDIFKIKTTNRDRSQTDIKLSVECEHVYFELLDDYIEEADRRTFFPHELAAHINKFTSFDIKVEDYIVENPLLFPKKRVTITRGSPIKTILMMLKSWNLDLDRFRRGVTIRSSMNKEKLQLFKHQKNLPSFTRSDSTMKLTTRLYLIGLEGLSMVGLDLNDIPYEKMFVEDNSVLILSEDGVVMGEVLVRDNKVASKYINSKYIDNYPTIRKGEKLNSDIESKLELFMYGLEEINRLDFINESFSLNVSELKGVYGEVERFGLGYTALIQDEDLLDDYESGLIETRISEYTYYPFDSSKNSIVEAGIKQEGALEFFKTVEELKVDVEENAVNQGQINRDIIKESKADKDRLSILGVTTAYNKDIRFNRGANRMSLRLEGGLDYTILELLDKATKPEDYYWDELTRDTVSKGNSSTILQAGIVDSSFSLSAWALIDQASVLQLNAEAISFNRTLYSGVNSQMELEGNDAGKLEEGNLNKMFINGNGIFDVGDGPGSAIQMTHIEVDNLRVAGDIHLVGDIIKILPDDGEVVKPRPGSSRSTYSSNLQSEKIIDKDEISLEDFKSYSQEKKDELMYKLLTE